MTNNIRQSNFELLRIISMFLIVMSHCDEIFGLSNLYSITIGINKIITDWLHIGGQIGVGCFILVSGYFMVEQQITLKRILKLACEVWTYSIGIWLVWTIMNVHSGSSIKECLPEAKAAFFPILYSYYWFVTAYVILMALSPYLNKLIMAMDKKQYKHFLITLLVIFVVFQGGVSLVLQGILLGMVEGRFVPVLIMYFISGYIRRFGNNLNGNATKHIIFALIFYLILFASFYIFTAIGIKYENQYLISNRYFFRPLNSPLIVIIDVELFLWAKELKLGYSKLINGLASCTFGIYLIHGHLMVQDFLSKCFPIYKEENSLNIFVYSLISVIIIYLVCTIIDFIRQKTIGNLCNMVLDKAFTKT